MGILSRIRVLPQQRLDLEDVSALLSALRTDSKLYTKQFLSSTNLIYKGFTVTGIGLKSATVVMADATLIIPQNSFDFSWFTSAPAEPNITIPDADLVDNTRNYIEIKLATENNTPLTKAFWDPEANAGLGSEFNQIVETITDLKVDMVVSTSGFSGSPDRLPLCIIDTDSGGNIKTILDRRNLFGRLAIPSDIDHDYVWGSKIEPTYAMTLTGVVGTFLAGETLTINTETAKCTTGGTTSIAFNVPSGINFFPGSSVTGGTSGATGTVNSIAESFTGVDKNLRCQKDINDALMTEMKLVKGTRFWWEDPSSSIVGIVKFMESVLTQNTATAAFSWDGSNLKITDDNVSPANDTLGFIRILGRSGNLSLTREDGTGGTSSIAIADGEVLFVKVPATGARTYSATGSGDTNYQKVQIASYVSSDETYWLAYREGTRLYVRGYGELEPGEVVNIGDPELEDVLAAIAANQAKANQDRTHKMIEGGTWSVNNAGTQLTLSANAYIQIPGLDQFRNTISAQNISLPNATSVAYISILRTNGIASIRSVTVANENAIVLTDDIVVIARRVSNGILVGESFLLKPNEYLELDGALAEINRLLGQLRITAHPTSANKAKISASDVTLLNGTTLSQVIGDFLLKLDGAVINFSTGVINKADDVTPLGVNFTPFAVPVGQYYWYGISLLPDTINADNTQNATVQVDLADSANAVAASALKAVMSGDIKLGEVQVFNNAGSIQVFDIHRLGVGSGSGSGSGDANSVDTALRDRFGLNNFLYLTENVFRTDKSTKVHGSSTGAFAPAKKAFGFSAAAQTLVSINHLDSDFLSSGSDISEVEWYLFWLTNFVDTAATYEITRDGGVNWQTASMTRIGVTNAYRVYHTFSAESILTSLQTVAATGAGSALNATTNQQLASKLILANASVLRSIDFNLNYGGVGVGTVTARLVKDSAGVPSTSVLDILSESDAKTISTASLGGTGNITVTFDMPDVVLPAGTYHMVLLTDAAYKAGTLDLSWRSGAGTNGATYNGTTWTSGASSKAATAKGRVHDLRIRVTSSAGDKYIEGYGVYYGYLDRGAAIGQRKIQKFVFSGDENRTNFTTNFELDPEIVTVYDPYRGQTYVVQDGVLRNEGNTLKFEPDTFDFPGETIVLIARQLEGNGTDTSNANAAAISEIQFNLLDLGEEIAALSNSMILPKINVPFTAILNRAQIPDLTQDLKPRFAVDTMIVQQLSMLIDESGPNGEAVQGAVNDKHGQIRFVGNWVEENSVNGSTVFTSVVGDYVEITFYGTGLNLLTLIDSNNRDLRYTVDGGVESANFHPTSGSNILNTRNYKHNQKLNVVSGLTLAIHTVKIRFAATVNFRLDGFEILNEQVSGLIQLPPGSQYHKGKKRTHSTLETTSYNSSFESGVLGSRGGRVLIYQKSDGSVAKAVTPTDASQLNMSSANHANEEVARVYSWREFGAARADDISLLVTAAGSSRFFTLDDGTATLLGQNLNGDQDVFYPNTTGDFITFTFVGTGLDFIEGFNTTPAATYTVSVDGTTVLTTTIIHTGKIGNKVKIVSGLPYGTHVVRFARTSGGSTGTFKQFIVYRPKTPTLPTGAVSLGAYNIMANFVANTTAAADNIATGVLRKQTTREMIFLGAGWSDGGVTVGAVGSHYFQSSTTTDAIRYTFFGTGLEWRFLTPSLAGATWQVNLDGATNLTVSNGSFWTGSLTTNLYGNGSFTANTGTFTTSGTLNSANGLTISGLNLGLHTITITRTAGGAQAVGMSSFDIITPIHSHKLNGPVQLQNTHAIGNQGILDLRKFTSADVPQTKLLGKALGVSTSASVATAIGTYIPVPDMSLTFTKTKPGLVKIDAVGQFQVNAGTTMGIALYVNNLQVGTEIRSTMGAGANETPVVSVTDTLFLPAGNYKIDLYWSGSSSFANEYRTLTAYEAE